MDIGKKIDQLQEELHSIVKAEKRLAILMHELDDLSQDLALAKILVDKEYLDVQKLEKTTTSYLYKKFLGDIDQKLDEEREQYLMAILKYDDLANKIKLLEFEKEILENKIELKDQVYTDIQTLIIATKSTQEKHHLSDTLIQFENKIKQKKEHLTEISEATEAASELKIHLKSLLKNLASFEDTNNNQLKVFYYDQIQQLKNFRQTISLVDQLEQNLNKELKDINHVSKNKNLYTPYISFFENVHSEMMFGWISNTHFRRAKICIMDNIKNTDHILAFLKTEKTVIEYDIESLEKEKKLYLDNC
jgi:DNA repair exonuclease SbcCD ATPase subunit